jgi:hypothetical protein
MNYEALLERDRAARDRVNARKRERRKRRRQEDPAYRERMNAYERNYYATHPERRVYKRDWKRRADQRKWERENPGALHELACEGPRSAAGCTCQEVILAVIAS